MQPPGPGLGGIVRGLSARLLVLTVFFVMLSEVLIYVPSIANFRHNYLEARLADANLAAVALEARPDNEVSVELARDLLDAADLIMVALKRKETRSLLLVLDMPPEVDVTYDMRAPTVMALIMDAFEALARGERTLHVIGAFPDGSEGFLEIILEERALRDAMLAYSTNILQLSIVISLLTASLVFLSLHVLFVRPMRDITASMIRFREAPEDAGNVVGPSARRDEIGAARRELARMQDEIRAALSQKTHLAALGAAVGKINHDLRNMLATAHLVSDRLAASDDPEVRRATPTLLDALGRAITLCSATLDFGKGEERAPRPECFRLRPLFDELMAHVGLENDSRVAWLNDVAPDFEITGDREQLFRVFQNIARNAMEAMDYDGGFTTTAWRDGDWNCVELADDGPGLAQRARDNLFQPFAGSARRGGTGLGLANALELVRAQGGTLELAKSDAAGTTFLVSLPVTMAGQGERPAA